MADTLTTTRIAIVTGAAQGIGHAIALRLARDGCSVVVNDVPASAERLQALVAEIARAGGAALGVPGDVALEADVRALIARTVAEFGQLDIMVANAGIVLHSTLVDMDTAAWDRLFATNVRGTMLCYQHAAAQMRAQGRGGRIVGAASTAGKRGQANAAAYAASKFAVRGLTQSAALELAAHGITVNAYAPGPIDTPFLGRFDAFYTEQDGGEPGAWTARLKDAAATRSIGAPADVAGLVAYLVSREAHFITGQSIVVDGGTIFD